MTRYCLVSGKEWGSHLSICCIEGSLVATQVEGLFKKKRNYFTLDGKPLTPEQVEEMRRIVSSKLNSKANFAHWKASKEPEEWVRAHLKGWNHEEWLDFLASLHKSEFWPMEEAAIGQHVEMLRDKLRTAQVAPAEQPKAVPAPPTPKESHSEHPRVASAQPTLKESHGKSSKANYVFRHKDSSGAWLYLDPSTGDMRSDPSQVSKLNITHEQAQAIVSNARGKFLTAGMRSEASTLEALVVDEAPTPPTADSPKPDMFILDRFDADKGFGMVRKSTILSCAELAGVACPDQARLDFVAALLVFTALGMSQPDAWARCQAGRYIVQWRNGASDLLKKSPGASWEVPIALVVYERA